VLAPRALVADDDLKVRSTMVRMIQSLGFIRASAFLPMPGPCMIDKDPAHQFGR